MFTLFRSKPEPQTFELLRTDIHAHLLPGLDNGAGDMSESVALASGLRDLGFSHLFCTPHISKSLPGNTPDKLWAVFEAFRRGLSAAGVTIELSTTALRISSQPARCCASPEGVSSSSCSPIALRWISARCCSISGSRSTCL
jgi:hypothetical protein